MRNALGAALANAYERNVKHQLFCGDIGFGVFDDLRVRCPSQFHNFGISEQHMVSYAAAFSYAMKATSMVYTINPFITSRVHDQLRVDVAYSNAPLIICSVGAGFSYDNLGFTHYGIEDLALLSVLPNIRIYTPSDAQDVTDTINQLYVEVKVDAPVYLRLQKGGERKLWIDFPDFVHHGHSKYWDGSDIEVHTHGAIAEMALEARRALDGEISVAVRAVNDWTSYLASSVVLASNLLFLEENRLVGSLANQVIAHALQRNQPLPAIALRCVRHAEFEKTTLRPSALLINDMDTSSLITTIRDICA